MPTLLVYIWAENAGVGVSQWAAETLGIWQEKGGLTTQWKDNKVRERVWEIAQSMTRSNKLGPSPEQWDLLIDRCTTWIRELVSKRPLWKWYLADQTILHGQRLKAALDEFAEVGLGQTKNRINKTLTITQKFVHVGINFIALKLLLLFLMMCRCRRWQGRNLGQQVFADKGALWRLDRCPCPAI